MCIFVHSKISFSGFLGFRRLCAFEVNIILEDVFFTYSHDEMRFLHNRFTIHIFASTSAEKGASQNWANNVYGSTIQMSPQFATIGRIFELSWYYFHSKYTKM